jgi:hypothetical protein
MNDWVVYTRPLPVSHTIPDIQNSTSGFGDLVKIPEWRIVARDHSEQLYITNVQFGVSPCSAKLLGYALDLINGQIALVRERNADV